MNLKNHFLIAMPKVQDAIFEQSVVYICEHSHEGAMGIVINKSIDDLNVETVLARLDITPYKLCAEMEQPVFIGGPLAEEQGFILHTPQENFASSIRISDDIMITTSLDLLRSIGSKQQPDNILLALGYAGWQENQLEKEIINNDWLVSPAYPQIIFDEPIETRWQSAAKKLGVNINTISSLLGNA
ncbi:YqgE/AlgH family protein [Utexia brackfieldae]|uniref:YqgE/AlgH family protein n=1 Tax=Utexia brackfieldae TaxID=3074108 RepID=UPI00370D5290